MQWSYIEVPLRYGQGKLGVELGPEKLRQLEVDRLLPGGTVQHTIRVLPESEVRDHELHLKRLDGVVYTVTELADVVSQEVQENRFPLIVGGDHSMAIGTLAGLAKTGEYGVIWVDAHADLNTGETSPSGNIHGMPLAAAMGMGDVRLTEIGGRAAKIKPENLVYIGLRDIDAGEQREIDRLGIKVIDVATVRERGVTAIMEEAVAYLKQRTDRYYISFDMDSLDASLVPGTGTPVTGGLTLEEGQQILTHALQDEDLLAVELVELNPLLDVDNQTAKAALSLVETIVQAKESMMVEGK